MPRRSAGDSARDRIRCTNALNDAPTYIREGNALEKAEFLRKSKFSKAAVCEVVGISVSKLARAERSKAVGRPIGKRGRPQYLTEDQETDLESWCRAENNAGRGPTIDALNVKVLPFIHIIRRHVHTLDTDSLL